ncbi:MAG: DUF2461 family protein [Euzebyales bacterium]|nr:DUF2461 family protein [Euzebyales bacterium]
MLDTSTVILLGQLTDAAALPVEPLITAVTLAELSVGPLVATTEEERAARQAHLQQAETDFDPLPFDADAARAFGRVAATGLVAASGYWMLASDQLARYRQAVDDAQKGRALEQAIAELRTKKLDIEGQGPEDRSPRLPGDHPRVGLLRYTSVAAMRSFGPASWLATRGAAVSGASPACGGPPHR